MPWAGSSPLGLLLCGLCVVTGPSGSRQPRGCYSVGQSGCVFGGGLIKFWFLQLRLQSDLGLLGVGALPAPSCTCQWRGGTVCPKPSRHHCCPRTGGRTGIPILLGGAGT